MPTTPKPLTEDDIQSICYREIVAAESHIGTLSCYNLSGPTGCISTLSALTATFLSKRIVMAEKYYISDRACRYGHGFLRYTSNDRCVECRRKAQLARYYANPEAHNAAAKEWAARNPEKREAIMAKCVAKIKADPERTEQYRQVAAANRAANVERRAAYNAGWYRRNTEHSSERFKAYYRENRDRYAAHTRKRQAKLMQRTPAWLTAEDFDAMTAIYAEAQRLTLETGIPHEVDHILPLQGRAVSGLHVPSNLRIVTRTANRSKGNKHGD